MPDPQSTLLAGTAVADITPQQAAHLAGAVGAYRPWESVADPLCARALVLSDGDRRACLVTLDVTIITGEYTERIRRGVAERTGIAPDAIMVHATQTHSAPSIGHIMVDPEFPELPAEFEWVRGGEAWYSDWAAERVVEAVTEAAERLEPVDLAAGRCIEGRWAFNRRAVRRDGTVGMPGRAWDNPLGPTWIHYIEGPIDPELGVLALRTASGRLAAVVANYACHPVHVFPKRIISADWPGSLAGVLSEAHGGAGIVVNGCCGNINPWPPFDPDYADDHNLMGQALAERVSQTLESLEFAPAGALDWRIRHVQIPLRELTEEELVWADKILTDSPCPAWIDDAQTMISPDWMTAASIRSVELMRSRSELFTYEMQVLRIGDVALLGLPGEPFAECGLAIKMASPFAFTWIAHCTSHYVGYIPTAEALTRGGHEAQTRYWAKLAPEAFDIIVREATELLRAVWG